MLRTSSRLLVSFISLHKTISSQSVSRWLTRALRLAGVDTSAAAAAGLSVDLILEAADWASAQTFEQCRGAFARALM